MFFNFLKSLILGSQMTPEAPPADDTPLMSPTTVDVDLVTVKELLMGRAEVSDLSDELQANLKILHERINKLRVAYGKAMKVNDGYRRAQDKPKNGAAHSTHYRCLAVDIDDNDAGDLWFWVMENLQLLKDIGLWMEHGNYTHNKTYGTWCHFQVVPPGSGKRIYVPSTAPDPNPSFWNGKYDSKYD